MNIRYLLLIFLAPCLLHAEEEQGKKTLLSRPLIIGASLSAGFNQQDMIGPKSRKLAFDRHLDKALIGPHGEIKNKGNVLLFMAPLEQAEDQIKFAEDYQPSVTFAPDFLFWFLYGDNHQEEAQRLKSLELGLAKLDRIHGPLIVATIPNAKEAAGGMLGGPQIPQPQTLTKANARIKEWAKAREENGTKTGVLDLYRLHQDLVQEKESKLGDLLVTPQQAKNSLQSDKLHPTIKGANLIALFTLKTLQQTSPFDNALVNWKISETK